MFKCGLVWEDTFGWMGGYGMACDRTGLLVNSVNFDNRLQTQ